MIRVRILAAHGLQAPRVWASDGTMNVIAVYDYEASHGENKRRAVARLIESQRLHGVWVCDGDDIWVRVPERDSERTLVVR